jgi:hypothetical protein
MFRSVPIHYVVTVVRYNKEVCLVFFRFDYPLPKTRFSQFLKSRATFLSSLLSRSLENLILWSVTHHATETAAINSSVNVISITNSHITTYHQLQCRFLMTEVLDIELKGRGPIGNKPAHN